MEFLTKGFYIASSSVLRNMKWTVFRLGVVCAAVHLVIGSNFDSEDKYHYLK